MRICIYGAGAIGGFLAAELALSGQDVSIVARGPHLEAIRNKGLRLLRDGAERVARPRATEDPGELGAQDYVIITLKAHSVPGAALRMRPLLGPATAVVPAVNGVPWWYFYELEGPWRDHRLESVDPGGAQWRMIGPERVIGCVVYPACEVTAPGVVQHIEGDNFVLGEPDGRRTERAAALAEALIAARLRAPVRPRIRDEIWVKLWGNLSLNPLSALTHATLDVLATDKGTRAVARAMMIEAKAVGEKLGARFPVDVERRLD
ncbi:MAG: 2-dehydropantoate 2-reductase, partial [Alphaproteobacteria bacterium]